MGPISSPSEHDVLIVVDVQNDFCPGGALAVPGDDEVAAIASRLGSRFANVVLTQDWHSEGHLSFASSHQGKSPYETIDTPYGPQVLWPDHCVQGTDGAAFHADLDNPRTAKIIQKGFRPEIDSYSAFFDNDRRKAVWKEPDFQQSRQSVTGKARPLASSCARSRLLSLSRPLGVADSQRATSAACVFEARNSHQPSSVSTRTPSMS